MSSIRIETGCTMIDWGSFPYQFYYDYQDNEGVHRIYFSSEVLPQIGDTIANGVLVPRTTTTDKLHGLDNVSPEPIINNDPGFQKKRINKPFPDVWPRDS